MTRVNLRPILATAFVAIVCLALSPRPGADGRGGMPFVERLVATAVNLSEDGHPVPVGRIDFVIERWSTEAERESLRANSGPSLHMLDALQVVRRRAGTVLSPGLQGVGTRSRDRRAQSIQFAQVLNTPTGRQVVIATDQQLGFGDSTPSPRLWDGKQYSTDFEFTLIDIRFGPDGVGVGKLAPESKVAYNSATKTFEIKNYDKEPERLSGVRAEKP